MDSETHHRLSIFTQLQRHKRKSEEKRQFNLARPTQGTESGHARAHMHTAEDTDRRWKGIYGSAGGKPEPSVK